MKVGIVCSHGGHLTEMRYLLNELNIDDVFFITYNASITKNLKEKKYLFPNFGSNPLMVVRYLPKFLKILLDEKPDLIISNGAEIAIPIFFLAKILQIRTIFIECYTRINEPTITGKIVLPLSTTFIIPWEDLKRFYGLKALYLGNLFEITELNKIEPLNKNSILVIVGMHDQGFDRLIKQIDENTNQLTQPVQIQIGSSQYIPKYCEYFRFTNSYQEMLDLISNAQLVVCQGGMTIIDCLMRGTHVVAVPRKAELNEAINNHQITFTNQMKQIGLISVADDATLIDTIKRELCIKGKTLKINYTYINKLQSIINERHEL